MKTTGLIGASAVTVGVLVLAACETSSAAPSSGASGSAAAGGSGGKRVTLMVGVLGDPFYVSMECGA